MRKIAMVFDGDGVVFDTWPTAYLVWKTLSRKLEPKTDNKITEATLRLYWGLPGPLLVSKIFPGYDIEFVLKEWKKIELKIRKGQDIQWMKGAKEMLAALKQRGIYRGLLTNRVAENLREKFPGMSFEEYFDFIQTWRRPIAWPKRLEFWLFKRLRPMHRLHLESPFHKPNPRVFNPIMALLAERNIDKQSLYFVGDTLTDYNAAKGGGVNFCGVKTGPLNHELLWPRGTLVINSVADIPKQNWWE